MEEHLVYEGYLVIGEEYENNWKILYKGESKEYAMKKYEEALKEEDDDGYKYYKEVLMTKIIATEKKWCQKCLKIHSYREEIITCKE